jgi:RNA polymerase sigma-70 factor (ECF subfamily)
VPDSGEITTLLAAVRRGDSDAESNLLSIVYSELYALARKQMRRERSDHTLQPTALLNETYLRLLRRQTVDWRDRAHFFAVAAGVMRRILVDHARQRGAGKRFSARQRVELDDVLVSAAPRMEQLLTLDQALTRLGEWDARQARVVEMMYFGGLTAEEVSSVLGVSERTIKRDWSAARAWLQTQLSGKPA